MTKLELLLACGLLLGGLLLGGPSAAKDSNGKSENSCVSCHAALPPDTLLTVKAHGWKGSIHQRHGVTCDRCHGGDPSAAGEKAAHRGVLGSSNPQSPVYFKNIPATCGKCHGAEFHRFSQSLHYRYLEETGRGPECVTCHGSMETKVLAPATLVEVCQRCHNDRQGIFPYVPQKARAVLLLLRQGKILLAAEKELYGAKPSPQTASALSEAGAALHSATLEWHQFDLDRIIDRMQDFAAALKKLPPPPRIRPLSRQGQEGYQSGRAVFPAPIRVHLP